MPPPQGKCPESRKYFHLARLKVKCVLDKIASMKSKNLNSTSRALMLKQAVATMLSVPGQASTWSGLAEDEPDIVHYERTLG